MAVKYYVKVINTRQIALFYDAGLTLPAKINFSNFGEVGNDIFVVKLQSTSTAITYDTMPAV
jgi:hypothetical protein